MKSELAEYTWRCLPGEVTYSLSVFKDILRANGWPEDEIQMWEDSLEPCEDDETDDDDLTMETWDI